MDLTIDDAHRASLLKLISEGSRFRKVFKSLDDLCGALLEVSPGYPEVVKHCRGYFFLSHGSHVDRSAAAMSALRACSELQQQVKRAAHCALGSSFFCGTWKRHERLLIRWWALVEASRATLLTAARVFVASKVTTHLLEHLVTECSSPQLFFEALRHLHDTRNAFAGQAPFFSLAPQVFFSRCDDCFILSEDSVSSLFIRLSRYLRHYDTRRVCSVFLDCPDGSNFRAWRKGVSDNVQWLEWDDDSRQWSHVRWSLNPADGTSQIQRHDYDNDDDEGEWQMMVHDDMCSSSSPVSVSRFLRTRFVSADGGSVVVTVDHSVSLAPCRLTDIQSFVSDDFGMQQTFLFRPYGRAFCSVRLCAQMRSPKWVRWVMTLPELRYAPEAHVEMASVAHTVLRLGTSGKAKDDNEDEEEEEEEEEEEDSYPRVMSDAALARRIAEWKSDRKTMKKIGPSVEEEEEDGHMLLHQDVSNDPTSFLTTERTLFGWMGMCLFIALSGLNLLNARSPGSFYGGMIAVASSFVLAGYALFRWAWRNGELSKTDSVGTIAPFVDHIGPAIALIVSGVMLLGTFVSQIVASSAK